MNRATLLHNQIDRAIKRNNKDLLKMVGREVNQYALERSWLVAHYAHAWGTLEPYGGLVTASKILHPSSKSLTNYANVYRKYHLIRKDFPHLNFTYYSLLYSYGVDEEQGRDLLTIAVDEELSIVQFHVFLRGLAEEGPTEHDPEEVMR
jgi:hypothetical protein